MSILIFMVRLKIHIGHRTPLSVDLVPGVYTLGSDEENTIAINLSGIASRQLEIQVSESMQVHVRNLSDLDELKVDGKTVVRSFVAPGAIVISGPLVLMVELLMGGSEGEAGADKSPSEAVSKVRRSHYISELWTAFRYPMSNDSLFILVGIGVVGLLTNLFAGVLGWAISLVSIFIGVYILLMFSEIIKSTVRGEDEMPSDPSFTYDWDGVRDLVVPLYGMMLLPALPFVLSQFWYEAPVWLPPVLAAGAVVYVPMGLLILTVTDDFWAAHPVNICLSICRAPFGYFCVLVFLVPVIGISYVMEFDHEAVRHMNRYLMAVISAVASFLGVYMVFVWARMLGIFYRSYQDRLQWEG